MVKTITVYEAKCNLSKYLNSLRDGNEYVITKHGTIIGNLCLKPEFLPKENAEDKNDPLYLPPEERYPYKRPSQEWFSKLGKYNGPETSDEEIMAPVYTDEELEEMGIA